MRGSFLPYLGLRRPLGHILLVLSLSAPVGACSSSTDGGPSGGTPGSGGSATGGATIASGGSTGSGGKAGLGGSTSAGGTTGLGGAVATGGSVALGGTLGTGGSVGSGGAVGSGGKSGLGGSTSMGGSAASGGAISTGGALPLGGTTSAGGATASGGTPGTGGSSGGGGSAGSEYGFTYRPVQAEQLDWLCTLQTVGKSTYVYVRLDKTGTKSVGIATVPVYTAKLTQVSASGTVTDLAAAQYDYGGGHNNDSLQIDYQGKAYKYYHSSFGFGWRQCQPFDCVNEGCTSARTLPEVCVPIKSDGTHDPLVDTFKKCPGDSGG